MSTDYKEKLYANLFGILQELTEHDSPEVIFDRIVDDFASSVEYHTTQSDVFTEMLNTFRHNNPMETIPEDEIILPDGLLGGVSDINRQYMLEDRDNLIEFLKSANFDQPTD